MASYKVIQDIEAEDHILGPFTFRQFVYLLIAILFGYLSFLAIIKKVYFILILLVPPLAFFAFIAFPFIKDQPTEIWALAQIRFLVKIRKRVWDQSGIKNLVDITAPKKEIKKLVKDFDQSEIRNRLKRLSETIDSRGWVIKNVAFNQPVAVSNIIEPDKESDRLIDLSGTYIEPTDNQAENADLDIFDSTVNTTASKIDDVIAQKTSEHKNYLINMVRDPNAAKQTVDESSAEKIISESSARKIATSNLKKISTTQTKQPAPQPIVEPKTSTQPPKPVSNDIINLARNNNLSVQTLAKEINKKNGSQEVVISLR